MTKDSAVKFLSRHQPMPPDEEWTDELAAEYEKTRKYFQRHPDKDCIPLLLNSFGTGEGLGIYQMVEEIFLKFSVKDMLEPLSKALHSEHESVRFRAAQVSQLFPDERLIKPILSAIHHSTAATRLCCYRSLELIHQHTDDDYTLFFLKLIQEKLSKEEAKENIGFLAQLTSKLILKHKLP